MRLDPEGARARLDHYRAAFDDVPGWMSDMSAALMHGFLLWQDWNGYVRGDLMEVGVAAGRSAHLLGLALRDGERLLLNDVSASVAEVAARIGPAAVPIHDWSAQIGPDRVPDRSVRFLHVDGDHGRQAQHVDLALADRVVTEGGMVVLDDFLAPQFVGLTIGAIEWMATHPGRFAIVLAGFNKAYLCRPHMASIYLRFVAEELPEFLRAMGQPNFTLWRMAHPSDSFAVGISDRQFERDVITLDTDTNIPEAERRSALTL